MEDLSDMLSVSSRLPFGTRKAPILSCLGNVAIVASDIFGGLEMEWSGNVEYLAVGGRRTG